MPFYFGSRLAVSLPDGSPGFAGVDLHKMFVSGATAEAACRKARRMYGPQVDSWSIWDSREGAYVDQA